MGVVVVVLLIAAVASVGYYQIGIAPSLVSSTTTTSSTPSCTPSTCVNVTIASGASGCYNPPDTKVCGFQPATVTVVLGVNSTVVWTNDDTAVHTVTSSSGPLSSGDLEPGNVYQYTFTAAGNYSYHCVYHFWMVGNVIVKAPST